MLSGGRTHSSSDEYALARQPIIAIMVIGSTSASWVQYLKGRSKIEKQYWTRGADKDGRFKCTHIGQQSASQLLGVVVRSSTSTLGRSKMGGYR